MPETVLWFEPPMAANWDPVNDYWSTEEIHDLKFNEDKQVSIVKCNKMANLVKTIPSKSNLGQNDPFS